MSDGNFRVADQLEVGQTIQYKRVCQDLGRRPHGLQAASTYNGIDLRV